MNKITTFKKTVKLIKSNRVFEPNLTTQAILEASEKLKFLKKKKILDLGSGSGAIGIFLKKKYKKKIDLFLSDKTVHSVSIINSNLKLNKATGVAKQSDILKSWGNEKFDLIINDISAITISVAKRFWYNQYIPHDCGNDGIKLSKKFLSSVEKNLTKTGIILMPVISISDHKLLTQLFKKKFKAKLLVTKEWPAPKNLIKGKVANFLKKKYIFKKYNTYLCFTKVYKLQIKNTNDRK
jgi:cyclopropane fatty-acyl-phospholipid synthase-like methyltransferase